VSECDRESPLRGGHDPEWDEVPQQKISTVGIATRYGLDGPGIETRWR
jgi:hypothetical protein